MLKKIILLGTVVFLLFEVLYFDSNNKVEQLEDNDKSSNVYKISINERQDEFLKDYKDIILEINEKDVTVLTDYNNFTKIREKYPITIVK